MSNKLLSKLGASLTGAVMLSLSYGSAVAQETRTLSFSTWVPPQYPSLFAGLQPWLDSIEEESGGSIQFELYEGSTLGSARDHYDMAATGIADLTWIVPGYNPGRFPIIERGELPLTFGGTAADVAAAIQDWYAEYAEMEMEEVKFLLVHTNAWGSFHSRDREIRRPEDVSGLTVRPANAAIAQWVHAMGGTTVQIPAPEARDAVARGTVDAITLQWDSLRDFGIDAATNTHTDGRFYTTVFAFVMNKEAWDGLSEEQQAVFEAHSTPEWSRRISAGWEGVDAEGIEVLREEAEAGERSIVELSEDDLNAWREAASPLWDAWADSVREVHDLDPDEVEARLQERVKVYDVEPE